MNLIRERLTRVTMKSGYQREIMGNFLFFKNIYCLKNDSPSLTMFSVYTCVRSFARKLFAYRFFFSMKYQTIAINRKILLIVRRLYYRYRQFQIVRSDRTAAPGLHPKFSFSIRQNYHPVSSFPRLRLEKGLYLCLHRSV